MSGHCRSVTLQMLSTADVPGGILTSTGRKKHRYAKVEFYIDIAFMFCILRDVCLQVIHTVSC